MIKESIDRLQYLCETIPHLLYAIPEPEFSTKPAPNKWCKKEILGHLIDSTTNNHQRFVRAQFEDTPTILYDQDNWNACSYYHQMEGKQLILFWTVYNKHLVELMKRIPEQNLSRLCKTNENHTLEWLFIDYVLHQEHHLKDIVTYDFTKSHYNVKK